ncbi:nucleotidyltransferase family protein [Hymenobacter sp. HSC-4F20]|uniref:nucleotidyltransferase family protein n=1 Tax=Hymenobacter sp. HSC-4F20 TaxID=2864135 RepID=UPI001C72A612|nr:nucleotidyltransferase family protein [Hymenobacter sp. HSC-4F20]MBX0290264.1 nucleotidyltransferase family protein [Hymenobacter sp. HSC-4F20]
MHAVLLLAAGASTRLGRPKQLLRYQGQTLLRRAAETAVAVAAGSPVVVVTGAQHEALLPELVGLPVVAAHCAAWQLGMGASLKCGLAMLDTLVPSPTSIIVLLCDQPHVTPALLREFVATQAATRQPIVASAYGGVQGVPVLFGAEAVPLLRQLPEAAGAAQLLKRHPELVATVPFPAGAVDVDTPEQYQALLASSK